ncbi:MAG: hypothetical protein NTW65_05935 [Deltaproteobacteria bacterium]|nr:hypothetical protein [Deltaproteobacteria bacterium]
MNVKPCDKKFFWFSEKAKLLSNNCNFYYQKLTFALITAIFISLTIWSWRKWPDLLIDFGQQLYFPWQLANGRHLYTDLACLHGPLSQHFNAIWFYFFGPSLTILIYINLGILACVTAIIYKTMRIFSDRLTAACCAIFFLTVFGFAQYVGIGNYNWITPYTHESTHGVALIAVFIFLWSQLNIKYNRLTLAASAFCAGLAVLTKADTSMAAIAVAFIGVISLFYVRTKESSFKTADALLFGGIFIAPAVCFFIYFLTYMPIGRAFAALGSGLPIISTAIAKNTFYLHVMGLDNVSGNLTIMAQMGLLSLGLIFIALMVDFLCHKFLKHPLRLGVPLAFAIFIILLKQPAFIPWTKITRALPLAILAALIIFMVSFFRAQHTDKFRLKLIPMILWIVLALTLLVKMILNVRFANYGFYMAMPAAVVVVSCLLYWIPQYLQSKFNSGMVFRLLVLAFLASGMINYLKISDHFYRLKDFPIGKGKDMFLTYRPERVYPIAVMDSAIKWIENQTPQEATFAALPEGILLNYLTRRATTIPAINFMMTELILFGQNNILADFISHPPDYVMFVHKDPFEFGVGYFGTDPQNGQQIMQWIYKNYIPVTIIGEEPFQSKAFGIKILKHNI